MRLVFFLVCRIFLQCYVLRGGRFGSGLSLMVILIAKAMQICVLVKRCTHVPLVELYMKQCVRMYVL